MFLNTIPLVAVRWCVVVAISVSTICAQDAVQRAERQKILILTCDGGSGHKSAATVLEQTLRNDYDLEFVNPFTCDIILTQAGEKIYSTLLRWNFIRTINVLNCTIAPIFFHYQRASIAKRMGTVFDEKKPDMVISIMPFINHSLYQAAHERNIPFLLITLDFDIRLWLHDFKGHTDAKFLVTLWTENQVSKRYLSSKKIAPDNVQILGPAVRQDFLKQHHDKAAIRTTWNIPDNKPVVMLMRGGTGSTKLTDYTKQLLTLKHPAHLLVCIGDAKTLETQLKALPPSEHVTFSIIPKTDKIADLMAVSTVLVTAPSPNTCNEALYSKLPMLIDRSGESLIWEKAGVRFVQENGCAEVFRNYRTLKNLVTKYITQPVKLESYKELPRFDKRINNVVAQLFTTASTKGVLNNEHC